MIAITVDFAVLVGLMLIVGFLVNSPAPYVAVPPLGAAVLIFQLLWQDVRDYRNARMRNLRK